ncbi:MAG: NAD(P)(+) transhydrogenase (Re/Si-specific) subunit beta [Tenacibaculum sp.]|nr:NAD(P)(+) transhydrogenase (Re/Si-specific) subunit beta [Tenacibaculum sp.]
MNITLSIIYLVATVTFVFGLKLLGHPETAKKGNITSAFGMGLAIIGTLFLGEHTASPLVYGLIIGALVVGGIIGGVIAVKVQMTKMPELVSLFNGFGGGSAAIIGLLEYQGNAGNMSQMATILSAIAVGGITLSGSSVAWAKLSGKLRKNIRLPKYNFINNIFFLAIVIAIGFMVANNIVSPIWLWGIFVASLVYGVLFVIPIGGADMPVVISLLNSFSGIGAAIAGVLYGNMIMLVGGILVGAAGIILTFVMCNAMNRPLSNVIFGAFGTGADAELGGSKHQGTLKKTSPSDTAVLMNYADSVVIVPGYGLAVSQAQHVIHELEELLTEKGVDVSYAIHPVAGRMPGHMNVLLAESNVAYDKLIEMDDINPKFANTDVVLVVGANDVVNPAAKTSPGSPIYGMPILEVENAKTIIVNKRSMNAGYAGIENELFFNSKTSMLFGDAKKMLTELVSELKNM